MYALMEFEDLTLSKNTRYSKINADKRVQKRTLEKLSSFFDDSEHVSYYGYKRDKLKKVIIPDTKISYDKRLFEDCNMLAEVILSKNSEKIPEWMFNDCWNLKTVIIPDNITVIEDFAFYRCCSIEKIKLPDYLEHIGLFVFAHCKKLKSIEFRGIEYTDKDKFNKFMFDNGYAVIDDLDELLENGEEVDDYVWG